MSSYPYAWPLVVIAVGTAVLLTSAYIALIALMYVLPVVLLASRRRSSGCRTCSAATPVGAGGSMLPPARLARCLRRARERVHDERVRGPQADSSRARETENGVSDAALTSHVLFVNPTRRGDGLRASINGHLLELADPGSGHRLAPTPDDLLIVSIASDLAWSASRFLRGHGLADDVNVSAAWRTLENPRRLADISVTVAVSETAKTMSDALMAALEERVAARSLDHPLRVQLHCQT